MTTKVVLFNGPPRSGKDTAANYCWREMNARHIKFSAPLKRIVPAMFNFGDEAMKWLEANKEQPTALLNGLSYRALQITISEAWMKPLFGPRVFGDLAVRAIREPTGTPFTVVSDSGFIDEAIPVVEAVGRRNVLLVHLHRQGTSFDGDSRSYIELDRFGVTTVDIHNDHELELFKMQVRETINKWLEG